MKNKSIWSQILSKLFPWLSHQNDVDKDELDVNSMSSSSQSLSDMDKYDRFNMKMYSSKNELKSNHEGRQYFEENETSKILKEEDRNNISPINKQGQKIQTGKAVMVFWLIMLIPSLFCAHKVSSYFLSDYYNTDNYDLKNDKYKNSKTQNNLRKNVIAQKYIEYTPEHFLSHETIGDTIIKRQWHNPDFGTLPYGKFISIYEGFGSDSYMAGYQPVTRYRTVQVPRYRTVDYGYGITDRYFDGYDYKNVPYQDYDPVYLSYNWQYALSVFDISDYLSIFENDDSVYSKYLSEIETQLKANYDYKSHYTTAAGRKAFVYYTDDGTPIKRVIFCANGRAYLMETKSILNIDNHSEIACADLNVKDFGVPQKDKSSIIWYFIIIGIACLLVMCYTYFHQKSIGWVNKSAHKYYLFSIGSVIVNLCIAACQSYGLYTDWYATAYSGLVLVGSFVTAVLLSLPLSVFYNIKSKKSYSINYIVPSWLKKRIYDKINNDVNKKLYLSFVVYPLMIGSLLPLGFYVMLVYAIPVLILSSVIFYVSRWFNWINSSKVNNNVPETLTFLDYYSILGISKDASLNDINVAYNAKIAFVNQTIGTTKYDAKELSNIQEAYSVLSSDKWRSLYNIELRSFLESSTPSTYSMSNKELEDFIKGRRINGGNSTLVSKNREFFNKLFFVIVAAITLALIVAKCSAGD
jgi:hypothetical protein